MAKNKGTFFERLTGSVRLDEYEDDEDVDQKEEKESGRIDNWIDEEAGEGELPVDVYQTNSDIIVKAFVAGVKPEDLDVSITRDMVTIRGTRESDRNLDDDNYFTKELYWGTFSKVIVLPQEIESEEAEAVEKHGLLIIKLPKIDKNKQTKLRVKGA